MKKVYWDAEFERHLREAGFKGSLYILRDIKLHLEAIRRSAKDVITAVENDLKHAEKNRYQPYDPLLGTSTRALCQDLVRFLSFEDYMSQTRIAWFTLQAEHGQNSVRG